MKIKFSITLLALSMLFLFSSTYFVNLSFALTPQEMDAEYEKSEEAKKNKNWTLAKDIVTPLAEQGHAKSQTRLGGIYLYGPGGVPKDFKKAFKWLKLGAEQDHASAQVLLGEMYYNGIGAPQDYRDVLQWNRSSTRL